jgi:organic hydroperoxide reductase OsmC/OhrA
MQALPHVYSVSADGSAIGLVALASEGAPELPSAPPREFDGPGDQWSPESLLVASVASCFVLTFRAVARASKLEWTRLECSAEGKLERIEAVTRFTHVTVRARLTAPKTSSEQQCKRALEKAERGCLISNSLNAQRALESEVVFV